MKAERFFFVPDQRHAPGVVSTRDWSLRKRLMLLAGTATVLAWLVGVLAMWRAAEVESEQLHDARLAEFARVVLQFADHEIDEIRAQRPGDVVHVESGSTLERGMHYQIWSSSGELLLVSADAPQQPFVPLDEDGDLDVTIGGVAYCVRTLWNDDRSKQIQVAEREDLRAFEFGRVASFLGGFFVVSVVGLLLLNRWMFGHATTALDQSAEQLLNRSPGDLRPIVADRPPRELKPLLQSINCLFGRVAKALESEHNFSATAAHELRTPLAVLRLQAQVADRAGSTEGARAALQQMGICVDRAARMVDQMLTLARVERAPLEPGSMSRIRLDGIASQIVGDLRPLLEERAIALDLRLEPAEMMGLEFGVCSLVRNLLENAARYSPIGGRVRIETGQLDGKPFVAVDDSGPGIPREERDRVFDPFYRLDNNGVDGCGVGLSIVRGVVRVHQARVVLSESSLGGLRAEVTFPASSLGLRAGSVPR